MQGFLSTTFSTIRAVAPKMLHGFGMSHIQHGSFNFMTNDVRGITNYTAGNAIPNLNMSKISRRDQYPTTMNPQMMAGDMRHMPLSALALTGTMLGSSWAVLDDDITLNPEQTPRKTWMDDWKDSFVYPPLEELEQNEKDINKSQSFIVLGDENAIQPKSGEAPQKTSAEILDAIEQNLPNNKKIIEEDIQKISDLAKELEKNLRINKD